MDESARVESTRQLFRCVGMLCLLCCLVTVAVSGTAVADEREDSGKSVELAGNGTTEDPYVVTTVEELRAVENDLDAHYVLTGDIGTEDGTEPADMYIGGYERPFTGVLDGRGHTIRGVEGWLLGTNNGTIRDLRIESVEAEYDGGTMLPTRPVGVIAMTNTGTITNTTVADASVDGRTGAGFVVVGGLVGVNRGGRIANSSVTGTTVYGRPAGGIAGRILGGTIEAVAVNGTVSGDLAGGIVGESNGTTIRVAKSSVTISSDEPAGGLVGTATDTRIEGSLAVSEINAPTAGGIVGNASNGITAESTYWDRTVGAQAAAGNGSVSATGLSTAQLFGDAVRANTELAVPDQWWLTDQYPVPSAVIGGGERTSLGNVTVPGAGTESNPYVITTIEQLQAMNADLDGHYALGSDINANETARWEQQSERRRGWIPIGAETLKEAERYTDSEVFTGTFDGRNHTIRGLTIDRQDPNHMGVFGVNRGTITDVRLRNTVISTYDGRNYPLHQPVGTLVGTNQGTLSGITVRDGFVWDRDAGGLVGENAGGTISGVEVQNVTIDASNGGGITAIHSGGRIEQAVARNVTVEGVTAGGIAGTQERGSLVVAASTGSVSGKVGGGLVGEGENGTIDLTRTTATVDGEVVAGGLIGNSSGMVIKRSYAVGETSANDTAGGIVGRAVGTDTITLYWDRQATGQSEATGEGQIVADGYPTANLTGNDAVRAMDGFDFARDWETTVGYPVLQIPRDRAVGEGTIAPRIEVKVSDPVVGGEIARMQLVIENPGAGRITYDPEILVGERELTPGPYDLDGGEQQRVNLSWNTRSPGARQIVIDGEQRGEFLVRAKPKLTIAAVDAPSNVTVGNRFEVIVTIQNTGGANATESVTGIFEGSELFNEPISLASGEQTELTITLMIDAPRTSEFVLRTPDDRTAMTITAKTAEPVDESSADDSGPGFGVGIALLAALLFAGRARE
ncbi:CARDB domain-containing protein [Halovenus sp. HT40]|uniref:CARDB domain-containing protein n=1 Tax=Halovenus sp. HT40 TaxID=3126691 RepID=UPI00300F73FD